MLSKNRSVLSDIWTSLDWKKNPILNAKDPNEGKKKDNSQGFREMKIREFIKRDITFYLNWKVCIESLELSVQCYENFL